MPTPTPVLSLALQIAAVEAADTRYEFIEDWMMRRSPGA